MAGRKAPPRRPKGTPKTGGRQKGTPNRVTVEAREAAAAIVDDPVYRANLAERAREGKLAPPVEVMLWHYAKGKPKETIEVSGGLDITLEDAREQLAEQLARRSKP